MVLIQLLRKIQAKGIQGLSEEEKKSYVPAVGGGFGDVSIPLVDQLALAQVTPSAAIPYGPGPFQYSQARIVADHVMTEVHILLESYLHCCLNMSRRCHRPLWNSYGVEFV